LISAYQQPPDQKIIFALHRCLTSGCLLAIVGLFDFALCYFLFLCRTPLNSSLPIFYSSVKCFPNFFGLSLFLLFLFLY
jgi:hypothetical protein